MMLCSSTFNTAVLQGENLHKTFAWPSNNASQYLHVYLPCVFNEEVIASKSKVLLLCIKYYD